MKHTWSVLVGNIGEIECSGRKVALDTFREYVGQSNTEHMRASGESVTIFCDGEVYREYLGTADDIL